MSSINNDEKRKAKVSPELLADVGRYIERTLVIEPTMFFLETAPAFKLSRRDEFFVSEYMPDSVDEIADEMPDSVSEETEDAVDGIVPASSDRHEEVDTPSRKYSLSGGTLSVVDYQKMAEALIQTDFASDAAPASLADRIRNLDASFMDTILSLIDEKGMKDSEVYKKANIDRRLFSKMRSDRAYVPSFRTAIALALALELDLDQTGSLLRKAGYSLSRSKEFDVIIEYFISNGKYNIFEINEVLYHYDQSLLGA